MPETAFVPYAPLDVPKPIADGVWIVDGPEIRFGYFGIKLPFPTRMTAVRMPDGGLWLHSPTEPSEALFDAVAALGPVRFLVAPNTIHYWWIPEWHARFPDAQVYGAPGLARSAKRPLPPFATLGETPPPEWVDAFDQVIMRGGMLTEVDFFHRASRTLILTDLIENFEPNRVRRGWFRWAVKAAGCAHPDGKAPIDMQLSFLRQRRAVRAAAERMIAWQPARIVLAHGRWYDRDGTAELRRAFRWVL